MNIHSSFHDSEEEKQLKQEKIAQIVLPFYVRTQIYENYVHITSDREGSFHVTEITIIFNCVNLINVFVDDSI